MIRIFRQGELQTFKRQKNSFKTKDDARAFLTKHYLRLHRQYSTDPRYEPLKKTIDKGWTLEGDEES